MRQSVLHPILSKWAAGNSTCLCRGHWGCVQLFAQSSSCRCVFVCLFVCVNTGQDQKILGDHRQKFSCLNSRPSASLIISTARCLCVRILARLCIFTTASSREGLGEAAAAEHVRLVLHAPWQSAAWMVGVCAVSSGVRLSLTIKRLAAWPGRRGCRVAARTSPETEAGRSSGCPLAHPPSFSLVMALGVWAASVYVCVAGGL